MPISIKEFNNPKSSWNAELLADQILNLLETNSDKAYSIMDIQTELKLNYGNLKQAMRLLRRRNLREEIIEWKWYSLEGRRALYYHYKKSLLGEK